MNEKTNENQNEEWNNLKEEELLNKQYVLLKQKSGDILGYISYCQKPTMNLSD